MRLFAMTAAGCLCLALTSCSTPDPGDGVREILGASLGSDRVHVITVNADRLAVTTVTNGASRTSSWALADGSNQDATDSGPTPIDQPSVDPSRVDVDDLATRVEELARTCEADWEVQLTAVTATTTAISETCRETVTDLLAGTALPSITSPLSTEGLATLWQELSTISPDGLASSVLIDADALTAEFPASPEQPTCEVRYQRDLATPRVRSVCRAPITDRKHLDLGRHAAETVWVWTQVLAQTNGVALDDITSLYLAPTGADDGSATLQLSTSTRTLSTVLKGDA